LAIRNGYEIDGLPANDPKNSLPLARVKHAPKRSEDYPTAQFPCRFSYLCWNLTIARIKGEDNQAMKAVLLEKYGRLDGVVLEDALEPEIAPNEVFLKSVQPSDAALPPPS
jgi:hypothetical protein